MIEGPEAEAEAVAEQTAAALRAAAAAPARDLARSAPRVLGPAPAPIERLRGRHRIQLLVKSPSARALAEVLRAVPAPPRTAAATGRGRGAGVRVILDVDPASML